jgi:steroid 5-alpha reductase family enzyme
VWASGLLDKGGDLCVDGPYRYVRHPLYLGSVLAAVGFAVMMNVIWGWIVVLPLFALLYTSQVFIEERHLCATYGDAYADFAARVPMLIAWRGRAGRGTGRPWTLAQALQNREHYHVVFTLIVVILFLVKWGLGS